MLWWDEQVEKSDLRSRLRSVGLPGTVVYVQDQVTDHGLAQLSQFPRLRVVSLRDTNVTEAGVERLRSACAQIFVVR